MRYEEAIKFCEGYLPECDLKKIAIEALEKQIQKKTIEDGYNDISNACPVCGNSVNEYAHYCDYCGQRLVNRR